MNITRTKDRISRSKSTANNVDYKPSNAVTIAPFARENARNATKFEGRRYLGRTAKGQDIWINFELTRKEAKAGAPYTLKTWSTASLDLLREEGAVLADCRVSFGTGMKMNRDLNSYLNNRMNVHGAVTHRTLDWIEQKIAECPENNPKRHELYQVANIIYVGTMEDATINKHRFSISDVLREWKIKENYSV